MKARRSLPKTKRFHGVASLRPQRRKEMGVCIHIKNILVPVDFSGPSLEALKFAAPLLRKFGANLHLVHVAPPDVPVAGLAAMPIVLSETASRDALENHLKRASKRSGADVEPATVHVLRGTPYQQICDLAQELKIDLIVIATRGETGLKHLLLGSTAERVVRYSPCPVLVVHQRVPRKQNGERPQTLLTFRNILVPFDFSDCSKIGLNYAEKFAAQFGSKLLLMHSVHLDYYFSSEEYGRYDLPGLLRTTQVIARKKLNQLVRKEQRSGRQVESDLRLGHAGLQICALAEARGADLIIISTHGRTGLKHVLLGSTAEYVVRHATCPVLVVPSYKRPVISWIEEKI